MSWKDKFSRASGGKSMDDAKARSGNNKPKIKDMVNIHAWLDGEYDTLRPIGPLFAYGFHNVPFTSKKGESFDIQKQCLRFNPETEERDLTDDDGELLPCPYCDADAKFRVTYYMNAIIRSAQENEPKKPAPPTKAELKEGYKSIESASWTPVEVLRMPPSVIKNLQKMKQLNKVKGEAISIADNENGRDISVFFDKDGTGDGMYKIQMGERTPITEEEEEYLVWNLGGLIQPEELGEAERELARLTATQGDGGDEDDDAPAPRSRKDRNEGSSAKKPAPKGKAPPPDDEDEFPFGVGDSVTVTDADEDELATGEIVKLNTRIIAVETSDGEVEAFKLSEVTVAPAKKPAPKGKAKVEEPEEEDDAGEEAFEVGDRVVVTDSDGDELATGSITLLNARKVVLDDDEDESHTFKLSDVTLTREVVKPAPKGKGKAKVEEPEDEAPEDGDYVKVTDSDDDDEVLAEGTFEAVNAKKFQVTDADGEEHPFFYSKVTVVKATPPKPKGKAAPKGKAKVEEPDDEDDGDDTFIPEEGDYVKVVNDDDEESLGTVTKVVANKRLEIETDDGEDLVFKWSTITSLTSAKKKPAGKKPAAKKKFSFDD